ncbi:MAG: class I SAM-dependent methyltransferase [Oligoflexia bacterium]|nr:class I SAM-dependent methyltransferase [Oligoflexia bacterium]
MILSLGSGKTEKQEGLTRVDISPLTKPDVVWDLTKTPYPFDTNSFNEILCNDIIEHLPDIPKVIEECARILKPGGKLKITTPHFSCANSYIDPTHIHHLSYFSMDYFTNSNQYNYYSNARFVIKNRQIIFDGNKIYKFILTRLANKFPKFYETRLAWVFPAWFIYFEMDVVKLDAS